MWKILSLQDDDATEIQVEFLFDVVIVLLETQLSQQQAIEIILNQVKIELSKFIELEENDEEKQKDEECLNQCIDSLRPLLSTFVADFKTLFDSRKTIISEKLSLKPEKVQIFILIPLRKLSRSTLVSNHKSMKDQGN